LQSGTYAKRQNRQSDPISTLYRAGTATQVPLGDPKFGPVDTANKIEINDEQLCLIDKLDASRCLMACASRGNDIDQVSANPSGPVNGGAAALPASSGLLPESGRPLSLLLLSDIRFMREGLTDALRREAYAFRTVSIAADVPEAMTMMRTGLPDLILIDATLPDGPAAVRRLREHAPEIRIIALAVAETEAEVIAWAEAGASGYVPRSAALADLAGFLTGIMRGEQFCSTTVAAGLLRRIANGPRAQATNQRARPALTAREEEIVSLLHAGLSNKEIARRLKICLATTKSHVHNVLNKLDLERRTQVSRWLRDHQRA
jgi:two-component system, NarL family, nitrate/nitrite response regulator NarL